MPSDKSVLLSHHDAPGDALERGHDEKIAAELAMCKGIVGYLLKHYPGHTWKAMADFRQGIAGIKLGVLMPDTMWFIIPLTEINSNQSFERWVRNAGGELLERYGLRRGFIEIPEFLRLREKSPWLHDDGLLQA